jgi:stage II sporulation protein D
MNANTRSQMTRQTPRAERSARGVLRWAFWTVTAVVALIGGCEPREIVRPTPQMQAETDYWVRVLIQSDAKTCTITASSPLRVSSAGPVPRLQPAQQSLPTVRSPAKVVVSGGHLSVSEIAAPGDDIILSTDNNNYILGLNDQRYRGQLRLTVNPDRRTFTIINFVPLEPYLAGVVGAEMPDYWEPEALKAQAIAARTYCLFARRHNGRTRDWDVASTQASQVYKGVNAESSQVWKAVNATTGKVLTIRGGRATLDNIFPAYFSAICGGHTEDGEHVFGDPGLPLRGVPCPYCFDTARMTLFTWQPVQFDRDIVTKRLVEKYPKLEALGAIKDVNAVERSDYGQFSRITKVKLVGETGKSDFVRGEDLRLAIDPTGKKIQSTNCRIVTWGNGWMFLRGRGWGHGVGLCQYGAQGMARLGKGYKDILRYYYPNAELSSLY